ncbi:unnamed protein product [Rhizophagus irregularis]|nr:unnamed protein product [Rhizophagus irregularis]
MFIFFLYLDGSFKLLWETFWRFFCISCDGQAFGRVKFPMTGQAFRCVKFQSRIGYWNLEMKGFDCVPGDWRRSRLQIVFWSP